MSAAVTGLPSENFTPGSHGVLVLERADRLPRGQDGRLELFLGAVGEHLALDQGHDQLTLGRVVARPEQRAGRGIEAPCQCARQSGRPDAGRGGARTGHAYGGDRAGYEQGAGAAPLATAERLGYCVTMWRVSPCCEIS